MARSRLRLLHVLKQGGPRTAAELAALLGITPAGVRQHLQSLEEEGLVVSAEERMPVGRPTRRWHLSEAAQPLFPDRHGKLTTALLEAVGETFGQDALERLLARVSERQIEVYRARMPGPGATLQERVEAIAKLRSEDGYMAECHAESEERWLLVENNCPVCAAASTVPALCGAELCLLRELLGEDVDIRRIEHSLSGSHRCAYEIIGSEDPFHDEGRLASSSTE